MSLICLLLNKCICTLLFFSLVKKFKFLLLHQYSKFFQNVMCIFRVSYFNLSQKICGQIRFRKQELFLSLTGILPTSLNNIFSDLFQLSEKFFKPISLNYLQKYILLIIFLFLFFQLINVGLIFRFSPSPCIKKSFFSICLKFFIILSCPFSQNLDK